MCSKPLCSAVSSNRNVKLLKNIFVNEVFDANDILTLQNLYKAQMSPNNIILLNQGHHSKVNQKIACPFQSIVTEPIFLDL